jgi:hypothetical protein
MAFDISQFRAQLQGDGARPNLFDISIQLPAVINPGSASQKLNFLARAAQLPGSSLGIVPLQYFGREIKLPGNRTFPDWTITVLNDEDFAVKNAMERWMNALNQHRFNRRNSIFQSATSYSVDGLVRQYSKAGNIIKTYKFIGMFPNDIAPIDLDWSANDTIEEFTVTFQYQWWEDAANGVL